MWNPTRLLIFLTMLCLVSVPQQQYSVEAIEICDNETPMVALKTHSIDKFYYIGSVFTLHDAGKKLGQCGKVLQRGLQLTEAFLWYLDKHQVKESEIKTGGLVFDSCSDSSLVMQQLVSFETEQIKCTSPHGLQISPDSMLSYVGADRLTDTVALAKSLNRTYKSIISPIGNTMLPTKYPYFLQGAPRYNNSSQVLVDLLKDNNIHFVIVLYQNEEFWINKSKEFIKQANASKICSVYNASISVDAKDYGAVLEQLQVRRKTLYVVIIADDDVISSVLKAANQNSIQLNSFVFLAIGLTVHDHNFASIKSVIVIPTVAASDINSISTDFLNNYKQIAANGQVNKPWIKAYCQEKNKPNCTDVFTKEKLDPTVPFLFLSLRSIMWAIHDLTKTNKHFSKGNKKAIQQEIASVRLDVDGATQNVFDSEEFLHSSFVKYKLKITNVSSLAEYTNGKKLDILNSVSDCPSNPCVECGQKSPVVPPITATAATASTTKRPASSSIASMVVPRVDFQTGFMGAIAMRSSEEFGVRDQKWIIPLGVLASLGVLSVVVFEIYILYKLLGTKLGRQWRTMWLGQLLLFGVLICYLTLFAYLPIPTDVTCGITRFGVGFSYAVVFSVMLVKLMVILTSKTSEEAYQTEGVASNYLRGTYQILMFFFALGVQLVIDIQWLITIPPKAVPITDVTDGKVWVCNHYTWSTGAGPDKSMEFSRNEFENHLLTLVYVMFLILLTTGVSMKAHGIVTNHRESIFIGLSAGLSIPLWVAWGLIGGLNRTSPFSSQYGDACIAFGLFLNATLILFAMFLPKVRQLVNMGLEGVYLEDDRDTAYAESVISYKTGYRSNVGPFMNGGGSIYNGSVKDPSK
ncbi:uncharacterized protein LOC106868776 [Octopus bimaculoides]|uniref:G-protein coupled receptors family 3 profile domain-containing protein n=1 Tax=Octopus bimaculoides TaxID=37653 RepID=A0A0L8HU19_OCTBM|nr:uncharacterized protein LOC106868776 [Octopus bimaculoides]|eukprot:XP_014769680.1 PREDICTED: uncharacterized protein LOC106868776 [Octopus bimaculoides]